MSDYSAELESATADIKDAGRPVTLVKNATKTFNPLTSVMSGGSVVQTNTYAVFTAYNAKDVDGEIIKQGDKKCIIAGPVDADAVLDGNDRYQIINSAAVEPGEGGAILTKLQVRK